MPIPSQADQAALTHSGPPINPWPGFANQVNDLASALAQYIPSPEKSDYANLTSAAGLFNDFVLPEAATGKHLANVLGSLRTKPPPESLLRAYKLFKVKKNSPGELFPLFMDAKDPIGKVGQWLDADVGAGPMAQRPAWHAGEYPAAYHIGEGGGKGKPPIYRNSDHVWGEVDMSADMDWYEWALKNGGKGRNGVLYGKVPDRLINDVPTDGFYKYKTNRAQVDPWLLSGAMRVNKLMTDEEVQAVNRIMGKTPDLIRKEPFDWAKYGFEPPPSFTSEDELLLEALLKHKK